MGQIISLQTFTNLHFLNCSHKKVLFIEHPDVQTETSSMKTTAIQPQEYTTIEMKPGVLFYSYLEKRQHEQLWTVPDHDQFLIFRNKSLEIHIYDWPIQTHFKRPFYLIAHRINDKSLIEPALVNGCNALEIDLTRSENGEWFVDHDAPTGQTLVEWLEEAKRIHNKYNLSLLIFDIKTVGQTVLELVMLYRAAKLPVPVCFTVGTSVRTLQRIAYDLKPHEGVGLYEVLDPHEAAQGLRDFQNITFSYGKAAAIAGKTDLWQSIRQATAMRDRGEVYSKIYVWTFANEDAFHQYLMEMDVDGIMVEPWFVKTARKIVDESPIHRLATRKDQAFKRIVITCSDSEIITNTEI